LTWTSVLAVPRSIPMSREKMPRRRSSMPRVEVLVERRGDRADGSRGASA
jgi:hypothetical protein